MKDKEFMKQRASDMTIEELGNAIKIKVKEQVKENSLYEKSPLQNPDILKILQQLCAMDKHFKEMKKMEATP